MAIDEERRSRTAQLRAAFRGDPPRELSESWQRSHHYGVELDAIGSTFVGHSSVMPAMARSLARLTSETRLEGAVSIVVMDLQGVLRMRVDGEPRFGRLLDSLDVSPGFDYGEATVGTTAMGIAAQTGSDVWVPAEAHYHPRLSVISEAAAVARDKGTGDALATVAVLAAAGHSGEILLAYARTVAANLACLISEDSRRGKRAVFDRFADLADVGSEWVVATDGVNILLNDAASRLEPVDLRMLTDSVVGGLALREFPTAVVRLPSGGEAETDLRAVVLDGEVVGCVLSARSSSHRNERSSEAVRRQGAHVATSQRRDYAHTAHPREDLDLLSPYGRAQQQVNRNVRSQRNALVIGEAGVGKNSLVLREFRAEHPDGKALVAECAAFDGDMLPLRSASGALFHGSLDDGPVVVLLRGLESLSPIVARRLDDQLRPLVESRAPHLIMGTVNADTVDAARPYGLVLRYFHDTVRVPPLRLRLDDIGDLALGILRKLAGGRSLRLSYQAVRVLEGYSWPGNISELEDVLRYVIARKPVGEIQARDLPAVCFTGGSRRLSMLESAQCDAIIHALYEAKGNRYKAAAALGIARSSLYRKIDSFGISYIA